MGFCGRCAPPFSPPIRTTRSRGLSPWGPEAIEVFADRSRNLGSFDPFRREMHLGLGAAIEKSSLAARAHGLNAAVEPTQGALTLSPDEAPFRVARVALPPASPIRDELYAAIPARHTNRGPYRQDQPVGPDRLKRLQDLGANDGARITFVADAAARRDLGALIVEATGRIVDDPEMSADSARWFRAGAREIAAHRDGVTLDAAGLSLSMTALAKFLPDMDAKTSDAYWLSMTRDSQVPTAPVLGMIFVRDRMDMPGAIAAGRAWQRLHLAATVAAIGRPAAQPAGRARRPRSGARPARHIRP